MSEAVGPQPSIWRFIAAMLALGAAFLPVAFSYIKKFSLPLSSSAGIYACFFLLLLYLLAPATAASRAVLRKLIAGPLRAWIVLIMLVLPYCVYGGATGDFRWGALARVVLFVAPVVFLYLGFPVRKPSDFTWQDALVAIWLVCVVLFHFFKGIWNVPANLDFMGRLLVVDLGALCWTCIRPVPGLGYELIWNRRSLQAAALNFAYFTLIAIPLGFALRFIDWNPRWTGIGNFLAGYLELLLFVAVLEELFFRGFLQNLLASSFRSLWLGQLIASLIFGFFHILHAPFPNWRYVILASVAGWFYGAAYQSGGTLLSSALVHAAVDTVWRTFLTRR
jgi:membrane protease YdiL (CAAX protease family)